MPLWILERAEYRTQKRLSAGASALSYSYTALARQEISSIDDEEKDHSYTATYKKLFLMS
jgi:hypothetical protein